MNTNEIESGKIIRCASCALWRREETNEHRHSDEFPERLATFAECTHFSSWATCVLTREDDFCSCAEEVRES